MTNHAHPRCSPPHPPSKRTVLRTQRPTALTPNSSSSKLTAKVDKSKASSTKAGWEQDEEDDEMATGFLQFCCRRKDGDKLPVDSMYPSPHTSPTSKPDMNEPFGFTTRSIVPRRKPTTLTNAHYSIPPVLHNAKSDLDPTEWKPNLKHRAVSDGSEAFNFLSKFHRSTSGLISTRRPALQTRRTVSVVTTAPSLSHTPTTSITTSSEGSPVGTPYDFVRPGMSSTQETEMYAGSASANSVDLITPVSTLKSTVEKKSDAVTSPIQDDLSYEKKWIVLGGDPVNGSLKKMLHLQDAGEMGAM
ncbi:MAG: hypothetical protein Q9187_005378 [Circinaria calcarea]